LFNTKKPEPLWLGPGYPVLLTLTPSEGVVVHKPDNVPRLVGVLCNDSSSLEYKDKQLGKNGNLGKKQGRLFEK
jgi:hypothetical protein